MGDLVCQICGKIKYVLTGGKCGSCGRFCCSNCYEDGACPSCNPG